MSLTDLTIAQARDGLRAGAFSAVDLTMAHLHAIEALNPRLNAFITVCHAQAVDQARAADAALAAGDIRPLTGIPLAIKDLFCTVGVRTTAGSKILGPFVPPYESTVTANLLRDGAVFLGKTNMDEFAMGSSNMTSAYGPVENPWKRRQDQAAVLVPGGSVIVDGVTPVADLVVADDFVQAQAAIDDLRLDAVLVEVLHPPLRRGWTGYGAAVIVPFEAEVSHLVDMGEGALFVLGESRADAVPHALLLTVDDPVQAVVALLGPGHQALPFRRRGVRPEIGRAVGHVDVVVGGDQLQCHRSLPFLF
jgi:hypothetical protein